MPDDSGGFDFDRQAFVRADVPKARPAALIAGILFGMLAVAAIGFIASKLFPPHPADSLQSNPINTGDDATLAQVNKRLSDIEKRLDGLEALRRATVADRRAETRERQDPAARGVHQALAENPKDAQPKDAPVQTQPDGATMQRLASVQSGVAALEDDEAASRDAWQAATQKMADMAGQVQSQSVEALRNQNELNGVLAATSMDAIPFELNRGADPQPVGPVTLALKSVSAKHQSYTLCVYIQNSCTELKDRMVHEVVQFVVSRDSEPFKVIGTKISDNTMTGYLEVPQSPSRH
jgi:hypothetical protein